MNKKIELLRIINNMAIVWVATTIMYMAVKMPLDYVLYVNNALLCLFLLISEVVQYFSTKIFTFIPGHIAGIVFCVWLSGVIGGQPGAYTITRTIIMVIITIVAIHGRVSGSVFFYPTISEAFFFIAMMIAGKASGKREAELVVLFFELVWGILMVIFYNTRQTAMALSVYKRQARVPYDAIKKTNRFMMRFYLLVTTVVMLLCTLLDYGKEVYEVVKNALIAFLRWFFSHFTFVEEEDLPLEEVMRQTEQQHFRPLPYDDNVLLEVLWDLLFYTVSIAVFVAIVITIYKVIRNFIKDFNQKKSGLKDKFGKDKVEYLNPLSEEGNGSYDDGRRNRMTLRARFSPRGNVRRLFKDYISRGKGFDDIRDSETPKELEENSVGMKSATEKGQDAVALYEKARYSSLPITSDDVKLMKNAVR
jgi:hypothetical protein